MDRLLDMSIGRDEWEYHKNIAQGKKVEYSARSDIEVTLGHCFLIGWEYPYKSNSTLTFEKTWNMQKSVQVILKLELNWNDNTSSDLT